MSKITSTITYGNTDKLEGDDWRRTANPWTVELRYQRRRMTVHFWTGSMAGEPNTADVVWCLAADASGLDCCRDFDDWADNYGYDRDSRKAEALYRQVQKQTEKFRRLLGDDFAAIVELDEDAIAARCA